MGETVGEGLVGYAIDGVYEPVCQRCFGPVEPAQGTCALCVEHIHILKQAVPVLPLFYVIKGTDSGTTMHAYKTQESDLFTAAGLALRKTITSMEHHVECLKRIAGLRRFDVTTVVPSSHKREYLAKLVTPYQWSTHGLHSLLSFQSKLQRRELKADAYVLDKHVSGANILLVDDTWVTGAHAGSAALTLLRGGARSVSILILARWLNPERSPEDSLAQLAWQRRTNPATCAACAKTYFDRPPLSPTREPTITFPLQQTPSPKPAAPEIAWNVGDIADHALFGRAAVRAVSDDRLVLDFGHPYGERTFSRARAPLKRVTKLH